MADKLNIKGFNGVSYGTIIEVTSQDVSDGTINGTFSGPSNNGLPYPLAFNILGTLDVAATNGTMGIDLGADPVTGLNTGETYGIKITIDSGTPVEIATSTEAGTTLTAAAILSDIESVIGGSGSAALDGTEITITSATTGANSAVLIEAGTVADNDLISESGVSTIAAVDGIDAYIKNQILSDVKLSFNSPNNGDFEIANGDATFTIALNQKFQIDAMPAREV